MAVASYIVAGLGALVVVLTGLSFVRSRAWWVRVFDFPRPQIALLSAALLGALVWTTGGFAGAELWERILLALLAAAVVAQLAKILPYTPLWRNQVRPQRQDVPDGQRLRILIANVRMRNRAFQRLLDLIRKEKPALIITVEVDDAWCDALRVLEGDYPHRICVPQDNTYGIAVYSRHPLEDTEVRHLVEPEVPSVFSWLELPCGQRVRFVVVHPRPPRPDIQQDSSLRDAELVRAGDIVRGWHGPVFVAGDLNDVAWSHTTHLFQRLACLLDPRVGRGVFATFPVASRFIRFPLDHVFHSNDFNLVEIRRLPDIGSDHYPMLLELALCEKSEEKPEEPRPDHDDVEQARDAVDDARKQRASETPRERRERQAADR